MVDGAQRKITRKVWNHVPVQKVTSLPMDINGTTAFRIRRTGQGSICNKTKDGRPWKRDSRTVWKGFERVRYKDCGGSFICPNVDCSFLKEFHEANRLQFGKDGCCLVCGAMSTKVSCPGRKYIAMKGRHTYVYHCGEHTCAVKKPASREPTVVSRAVGIDPSVKPSTIQTNFIVSALREQRSWEEVDEVVRRVSNRKSLSNEKCKQKKKLEPNGSGFVAVKAYKAYTDKKDAMLVYRADENEQFVFKTSRMKMEIAAKMSETGDHFLKEEYVCFDGNHKRVKNFVTLTASVYHPLLRKQIPLGVMECKHEDSDNVERYWTLFQRAFKDVNGTAAVFSPIGWACDMAGANFNGLKRVFGEEALNKIKGCEFHFKDSVNARARSLNENAEIFKNIAIQMLESETVEGYSEAYESLKLFVQKEKKAELKCWLDWWHERRNLIFRAFTSHAAPRSNQAEVVHASWKNRDRMGMTLLEAALLDTRDSLLLKSEFEQFRSGSTVGRGPSMASLEKRKMQRERDTAERAGQEVLDLGVENEKNDANIKKRGRMPNYTGNGNDGCKPPKTVRKSCDRNLLDTRISKALDTSSLMKVRSYRLDNELKRAYKITSSQIGRKFYDVTICNTPSCTCPDYKKNGTRVFCKHILFALVCVLGVKTSDSILDKRVLGDDDVKNIFAAAPRKVPEKYRQEQNDSRCKTSDVKAILVNHADYNKEQEWRLHEKSTRSAMCRGCHKTVIEKGKICLKVEGAISVPFGKDFAVLQTFYFCADKQCLLQFPPWTNIRPPLSILSDGNIDDATKETIASNLNVPVL